MNPLPSTVDWTYWQQFPTLKIWELAALMCQIDPRALGDTTDRNGDPIDLRDEERMLIGAVNTMLITAHPALNPPRSAEPKTEVQVVVGFNEANNLDNPLPQASTCGGATHCVTLRSAIYREGAR